MGQDSHGWVVLQLADEHDAADGGCNVDGAEAPLQALHSGGFVQVPNQQNSAACSLRYLSQPHEDGAHFVRPVHIHVGTNGKLLPNMERMEPFNVIYQTAEDGLGDTVKPRLIEAGADLDRVLVIDDSEVQLTLSDERIEKAIIENNARLVIIDPIQAYLGADVDMNRANEVRPIFMRLGQVAQRTGCAILLIGHLNKAAGMQSLQRGLGSIDIAAAVRSVMFIGKLKHDPTMRILTHEKSSLAPPGASVAFSLGDEGGFRWVGEYDITADEMLSGIEPQRETKTQQAKDLICALLAGGKQVLSEDIDKAALERGIPGRTVRDAKRELGDALKSKIVEGRKKVFWME